MKIWDTTCNCTPDKNIIPLTEEVCTRGDGPENAEGNDPGGGDEDIGAVFKTRPETSPDNRPKKNGA